MKASIAIVITIFLAVGIAVPSYYFFVNHTTLPETESSPFATSPSVSQAGTKAFGSLATLEVAASRDTSTGDSASIGVPTVLPEYGSDYRISYVGSPIQLTESTANVLERQVPSARSVADMFRQSDFGVINLEKFPQGALQSFVVAQTTEDGYSVSVDLMNGAASVSAVATPGSGCDNGRCITEGVVTTKTVPSDAQIIAVANAFIESHDIATTAYGTPTLTQDWKMVAESKEITMPISSYAQVIYPLAIEGMTAYSLWGDVSGMTVTVDTGTMTVSSVYNIANQAYQSSAYPAMQDSERVLEALQRGGVYGSVSNPTDEAVEIQYGTPTKQMVLMSRTDEDGNYVELLVPGLVFPVVSDPQGWHRPIVVPLVDELFEQQFPVTIEAVPPSTNASSGSSSGSAIDSPTSTDPVPPDLGY